MKYSLFAFLTALVFVLLSCSTSKTEQQSFGIETTATGLKYQEITLGKGNSPVSGQRVSIHYIMKLDDGTILENTYNSQLPMTFKLGSDDIIKGLDEGIRTMKKGGKRIIFIPPELGFGARTVRNIPDDSNLIVEVELIDIN